MEYLRALWKDLSALWKNVLVEHRNYSKVYRIMMIYNLKKKMIVIYFGLYVIKVFWISLILIGIDLYIIIPNWQEYIDWDNYDTVYFIKTMKSFRDDPRNIEEFFIETFWWYYKYFKETYIFFEDFSSWKIDFILKEIKLNILHWFFIDVGGGKYFLTVFQYMDFYKKIKMIIKEFKEIKNS